MVSHHQQHTLANPWDGPMREGMGDQSTMMTGSACASGNGALTMAYEGWMGQVQGRSVRGRMMQEGRHAVGDTAAPQTPIH